MNLLQGFLQYAAYRFIYNSISKVFILVIALYGIGYATGAFSSPSEFINYIQNVDFYQLVKQAKGLFDKVPYFIRNMF